MARCFTAVLLAGLLCLCAEPVLAKSCTWLFGAKKFDCLCRNYGFTPGTTEFAQCLSVVMQPRPMDPAMMALGLRLLNPPQPAFNPPLNCTTVQQGAFMNTHCW
jgi:hypothetical protein